MTNLSTLPCLPGRRFPTCLSGEQPIAIKAGWWRDEIRERGLPGTPPAGDQLTRADVWAPTDVFTLLWRTLAWGSGTRNRVNRSRLAAIAADVPRCEDLLTKAADLSRSDPAAAFALLRPGDTNEIRYLGPSFSTKFLYFAGGGAPGHPCLILDRRVATALRDRCGWTSLDRIGPWPAE